MLTHKFKIVPKDDCGTYDVEMDDVKLQNVTDIQIDMHAGELPIVQIEFLAFKLETELPYADVEVKGNE